MNRARAVLAPFAPAFLAAALAACNGPPAPQAPGVCWQAHQGAASKVSFSPLAHDVGTLEACAVLLEAEWLQGQRETDGAYQGYFIFIGERTMSSALHTGGVRYPIFQPTQRAVIDREIKHIMAEHGGKMPDASEFSLEHQR